MDYNFVKNLIDSEHFGAGKSIRRIERENGITVSRLNYWAKLHGIDIKSRNQSIRDDTKFVDKPTGDNHWSKKKPEVHRRNCAIASERMTNNNPSHDINSVIKCRDTLSKIFKNNPTPHEKLFASILDSLGVEYSTQERIMRYNPDFAIGNTLIELDGRGHASRAAKDSVRDKLLCEAGYNVVRIKQDSMWDKRRFPDTVKPGKLLSVIKEYVSSLDLSGLDPSFSFGKYRVLVREAYTGAEVIY